MDKFFHESRVTILVADLSYLVVFSINSFTNPLTLQVSLFGYVYTS